MLLQFLFNPNGGLQKVTSALVQRCAMHMATFDYDNKYHKKDNLYQLTILNSDSTTSYALEYVDRQTPEICLAAVKKHGYVLEYVKEQTPELCLEAIKQYGEINNCYD